MSESTPKLIFIDLETGGLNPNRHPIIQLAAIATDAALNELEYLELKVQFQERTATKASLRKIHYTRNRWAREAIEPYDAARTLAAFLRRHATVEHLYQDGTSGRVAQLVAHNAGFDGPFLHAWFDRLNMYCPARFHVLCTMQRAMWLFAEEPRLPAPDNYKLATLCRYFQVPLHPHEAHEALADVRATVRLYRALASQTEPSTLAPNSGASVLPKVVGSVRRISA
jgi:DNA polymerase III epsilon subunit-like protein